MGMAASQARLLTITARMHDIEYQAQSIQNAKIQLATQSDEVYQEYLDALNATSLTVKDVNGNIKTANFYELCSINAVDSMYEYAFTDEKGRLLVMDEIAKGYQSFISKYPSGDAYEFAMYMLGVYPDEMDDAFHEKYMSVYEAKENELKTGEDTVKDQDLTELLNLIEETADEDETDKSSGAYKKDKDKNIDAMRTKYEYQLFKRHAEEMYRQVFAGTGIEEDFDQDDFNYYANWFKMIQEKGGSCVSIANATSISNYDGFDGDAAKDSDWLENMIRSGKITVDHVNYDKKNGKVSFASTGVPSDSVLEYTTTSTIDKTALAKAEAEYEHKTKELDRKDKKFDLDLSKLDTQRTALKTEYESVKKVISENIDRTFGIFS